MEIGGVRNVATKTKEIQINKRCQSDQLGIFYIISIHQSIMIWTY